MKTILFQGDSITDCGRIRENVENMGNGYPLFIKARLEYENHNKFMFRNRGIGGAGILGVYERRKADIIDLSPDYMSILVGVNNVWNEFLTDNGVDFNRYEKIYSKLIEEVSTAVPDIKIIILEPFFLKGSKTEDTEEIPDRWEKFSLGMKEIAKRTNSIAEKYSLPFIPLQHLFEQSAKETNDTYWLIDGIHPTEAGHELISREWLKVFYKYQK